MRRGTRTLILGLIAATSTVSVACTKELMAGGEQGEVVTRVNDDEGVHAYRAGSRHVMFAVLPGTSPLQGTVQAAVQLALVGPGGIVDPVARSSAVQVGIGSSQGVVIGEDSVDARSYTAARVTFSSVSANITGGLLGGLPLLGTVTVDMPEPITVDFPISLTVQPGSVHELTVDLNAATWLGAMDRATLTVPVSSFRAAVQVSAD